MNHRILLFPLACAVLVASGCESDQLENRRETRSVSVVTTRTPDQYAPYYAAGQRRYYRSGRRYVYYTADRPAYVAVLPHGARYVAPDRRNVKVLTNSQPYQKIDSPDWPR